MRRYSLSVTDVPLPGGQVLRAGLYRDTDGEPVELTLALGWGSEDDGLRPVLEDPMLLPAEALLPLRDALAALAAPTPKEG